MVNISFDYNPESKGVTNLKVTPLVVSTKAPKATKPSTIQLQGGSLKLTESLLNDLQIKVGDRVCVRFKDGPIIATPEALGETGGGNLVTKSMTVACKGKVGEELAKYGENFTYTVSSTGYATLHGDTEQTDEAVQPQKDIAKTEIKEKEDDVFSLTIPDGEEINFNFEL